MVSIPMVEPHSIKVILVDDHELVRRGIKQALSGDRQIKVIGEAASGPEAIDLISQLQPDIAIVDIRLRHSSGIDVARAVKIIAPTTRILVLSAYDYNKYVNALVRIGAAGYLLKSTSAQELKRAVHDAADGKIVFAREVADRARAFTEGKDQRPVCQGETRANLTEREAEVLEYMAKGLKNRQIAEAMGISLKTVEVHVERILLKLRVESRTQAVLWVLQQQRPRQRLTWPSRPTR